MSATEELVDGVQIISDGTAEGTKVLLDGRPVRGVTAARWEISPKSRSATLTLVLTDVHIDAAAEVSPELRHQLAGLAEQLPGTAD